MHSPTTSQNFTIYINCQFDIGFKHLKHILGLFRCDFLANNIDQIDSLVTIINAIPASAPTRSTLYPSLSARAHIPSLSCGSRLASRTDSPAANSGSTALPPVRRSRFQAPAIERSFFVLRAFPCSLLCEHRHSNFEHRSFPSVVEKDARLPSRVLL